MEHHDGATGMDGVVDGSSTPAGLQLVLHASSLTSSPGRHRQRNHSNNQYTTSNSANASSRRHFLTGTSQKRQPKHQIRPGVERPLFVDTLCTADTLAVRALACWKQSEYDSALQLFEGALRCEANHVVAALGYRYFLRDKPTLAPRPRDRHIDDELLERAQAASPQQLSAAKSFFLQDQTDIINQFLLGVLEKKLLNDARRGANWYKRAADAGNHLALFNLGWCYHTGDGVPQDRSRAVQLYKQSAALGNAWACNNLGVCFERHAEVRDVDQAIRYYEAGAELGNPLAQCNLGVLVERGEGVERSLSRCLELYRQSADQGYAAAQNNLAVLLERGEGLMRDVQEAIRLYTLAAAQGLARAQTNLGVLHHTGTGFPRNPRKATEYYRAAASQANPWAMFNLALCYENGEGTARDAAEAVRLLRAAAAMGYTVADELLASRGFSFLDSVNQSSGSAH